MLVIWEFTLFILKMYCSNIYPVLGIDGSNSVWLFEHFSLYILIKFEYKYFVLMPYASYLLVSVYLLVGCGRLPS